MSAFDQYRVEAWPIEFSAELEVRWLCGGVPADPKAVEGWLRSKLAEPDDLIRQMVAEVMVERGVDAEEAAKLAADQRVNGFKRDHSNGGGLFIEGRQVKSALKEAVNVAVASGKLAGGRAWGKTQKGLKGFLAEHVVVVEDEIPLGVNEPTRIATRYIPKYIQGRGLISAIHSEEQVEKATLQFHVRTDHEFSDRDWGMIWLTGEEQGLGASRSQGFGRYTVTSWERTR